MQAQWCIQTSRVVLARQTDGTLERTSSKDLTWVWAELYLSG